MLMSQISHENSQKREDYPLLDAILSIELQSIRADVHSIVYCRQMQDRNTVTWSVNELMAVLWCPELNDVCKVYYVDRQSQYIQTHFGYFFVLR